MHATLQLAAGSISDLCVGSFSQVAASKESPDYPRHKSWVPLELCM